MLLLDCAAFLLLLTVVLGVGLCFSIVSGRASPPFCLRALVRSWARATASSLLTKTHTNLSPHCCREGKPTIMPEGPPREEMGEGSEGWSDFYGSVRPRYVDSDDVRDALWATDEFESDEVRGVLQAVSFDVGAACLPEAFILAQNGLTGPSTPEYIDASVTYHLNPYRSTSGIFSILATAEYVGASVT
jgi:hypothetical protein